MSRLQRWLAPTGGKRIAFFLLADVLVFSGSISLAVFLRFDGAIPEPYLRAIPVYILFAVGPKVLWNSIYRLYNLTWRFVGTSDIVNVFLATVIGSASWATLTYVLHDSLRNTKIHYPNVPRSILAMDFAFSLVGVGGVRMAKRIVTVARRPGRVNEKRLLVVGGGRTGERLIYEILHDRMTDYRVVGVIDDDSNKRGTYLHGVRVLGCSNVSDRTMRRRRGIEHEQPLVIGGTGGRTDADPPIVVLVVGGFD